MISNSEKKNIPPTSVVETCQEAVDYVFRITPTFARHGLIEILRRGKDTGELRGNFEVPNYD